MVERGSALVHVQIVVAVDLYALVMVVVMVMAAAELDHVGQQVERPADVPVDGRGASAAVKIGQRQVGQGRSAGDEVHRRRQRHVIRVRVECRAGCWPGRVKTLAGRLQRFAADDQVGQLDGG